MTRSKEDDIFMALRRCQSSSKLQVTLCAKDLCYVPRHIEEMQHVLDSLVLKKNKLSSLPSEMARLHRLQTLDVGCNIFTGIPECLTMCCSLSRLSIHDNPLQTLDGSILGKLEGLTLLNVSGCQLKELPVQLCSLNTLKELIISRNKLEYLPSEIGQLSNLVTLHANTNAIYRLPGGIGRLTKLKVLDVAHNQLRFLPKTLGKCAQLRDLDVRANTIGFFPSEIVHLDLHAFDWALNPLIPQLPLPIAHSDEVLPLKELTARIVLEDLRTKPQLAMFIESKHPEIYATLLTAQECIVCKKDFVASCIECIMFVVVKKTFSSVKKPGRVPLQVLLCNHACLQEQHGQQQYYGLLHLKPAQIASE